METGRRSFQRILPLFLLFLPLLSCTNRSSHSTSAGLQQLTPFTALGSLPGGGGVVRLDQPILVKFNMDVDLATVDLNSFQFLPIDKETGKALKEKVRGEFAYFEQNGKVDTRTVAFLPRLPLRPGLEDSGFQPGRRYMVHLNGAKEGEFPLIKSLSGKVLAQAFSFAFTTPSGNDPRILFSDLRPWGPRKVSLKPQGKVVKLNFFLAGTGGDILLGFDQPLNPARSNISPQRLRLEYKDPLLAPKGFTPIPARPTLVRNDLSGSLVALRPLGVLPSNAEIRVIAEKTLEDLSGQSNAADPAYDPLFGTFRTEKAATFQYEALAADFSDPGLFDPEAPQREPLADWSGGVLRSALPFPGKQGAVDFEPNTRIVYLDTDYCRVYPKEGAPFTVKGGVFHFRNIFIPKGVEVRGRGSNPLVLIASGKVEIRGTISVKGGDAPRSNGRNQADLPSPGGTPVCGGARGGKGSPETSKPSPKGEDGKTPESSPDRGGKGGHSAYGNPNEFFRAAGGGGGSYTTAGDPAYLTPTFPQMLGFGGDGDGKDPLVPGKKSAGGKPGSVIWKDGKDFNDFYGRDVRTIGGREVLVTGELKAPVGGAGGGGGGDRIPSTTFPGSTFPKNAKGGGGGAGGGILIIRAAGPITVASTGRLSADGGNGAGGEAAGSCYQGGGGGGGSGGMILLVSGEKILVEPKDHRSIEEGLFPVSADGGIGRTGTYGGGGGFSSKYPARNWAAPNRGGFGGMGLVEFMVPDPARDAVFPKGQVKPSPILLPAPYGALSRARTRWIYTGATARQSRDPQAPRYLDPSAAGGKGGPEYKFAGLIPSGPDAGYLDYRGRRTTWGALLGSFHVPTLLEGKIQKARPAGKDSFFHVVEFSEQASLEDNSLAGALFQVVRGGAVVTAQWRVAGNTNKALYLDPASGPAFSSSLAGVPFRVQALYFDVWSGPNPGLPLVRKGNLVLPTQNVRIGFAACSGFDEKGNPLHRYPRKGFAFDLQDPKEREKFWKDSKGGILPRPYLMIDILFNLSYDPADPAHPAGTMEEIRKAPRLELRSLFVPFRF